MQLAAYARRNVAIFACLAALAGCGGAAVMGPGGGPLKSQDGTTALERLPSAQAALSRKAQPMGAISVVTILYDGVPVKDAPVWLRVQEKNGKMKIILESRTGEKGRALFNNVPQNEALNLYYIVALPGFRQAFGYPTTDSTLPPPFPAALTCDPVRIKTQCKKL